MRSKASVDACPSKALAESASGGIDFSASKCIGCGACKVAGAGSDIAIYGTKLQKLL
jgi:ferredoxin-like protein FixX